MRTIWHFDMFLIIKCIKKLLFYYTGRLYKYYNWTCCWQDSIPCLFICGQARSNQLSIKTKTRQVGTQEINSIDIVKSITKFSITLSEKIILMKFCKKPMK